MDHIQLSRDSIYRLCIYIGIFFINIFIYISCDILSTEDLQMKNDSRVQDSLFISDVRKRVHQLMDIEWTPKSPMPSVSSKFFPDVKVHGIPYSSVKELDKFVGFDVSFHTFMTAVNNPRSVLYTENVVLPPYKGINCSIYYGTVCSAAVCYVLGINFPWSTYMVDSVPLFSKNGDSSPYSIEIGDLLWKRGHEALVYDIERNPVTNSIEFVSIFEAIETGPRIIRYNVNDYLDRWNYEKLIDYKYVQKASSIKYNQIPFYTSLDESPMSFKYNNDLCPQLGDKSVYREGDTIIINVLSDEFQVLELFNNSDLFESIEIRDRDVELSSLSFGRYSVVAKDTIGSKRSDPVYFDVVDTCVSIEESDSLVKVHFASEFANPIFAAICSESGLKWKVIELRDEDIKNGYVHIQMPDNKSDYYCKVYFETEWGRVTNKPIQL